MSRFFKWLDQHDEFVLIFAFPLAVFAGILLIGHTSIKYIKNLISDY